MRMVMKIPYTILSKPDLGSGRTQLLANREDLLGPHLCRPKAKALPSSSSGSADIQGRSTQIYHDTSDLVRKVSEMGPASI